MVPAVRVERRRDRRLPVRTEQRPGDVHGGQPSGIDHEQHVLAGPRDMMGNRDHRPRHDIDEVGKIAQVDHVETPVGIGPLEVSLVATLLVRLRFKRLGAAETASYIASGEWQGKAGGYAIQGRAAALVASISGSYSNVVGLPLFEIVSLLKGAGWWREDA